MIKRNIKNPVKKRLSIGAFFVVLSLVYFSITDTLENTDTLADLYADKQSGVMIQVEADVVRLLANDITGRRHQRFIIKHRDLTVLVAHNIDLAESVPVKRGDQVMVYGEYEWNDQGGIIHWTHYDPQGKHENGWIKHKNIVYGNAP